MQGESLLLVLLVAGLEFSLVAIVMLVKAEFIFLDKTKLKIY